MVCLDGSVNSQRALEAAKHLMKDNDELILATVPPLLQTFTAGGENMAYAPEMMKQWVLARDDV